MKFHLVVAVWGKPYIDVMTRVMTPTLLSAQNLPSLSCLDASDITFYTRKEDIADIEAAPITKILRKTISVRYQKIDVAGASSKYAAMSTAHAMAAKRAVRGKAFAVIVSPDSIFADGSLKSLENKALAGKRAVLTVGPRVNLGPAVREIEALANPEDGIVTIPPRALVRLSLDHMHTETSRSFFDAEDFTPNPVACLWRMKDSGYLARHFHLHPLLIDFSRIASLKVLKRQTIDGDFLGETIGRWQDVEVENDSDSIFMCTLNPEDERYHLSGKRKVSIEAVKSIAYCHMVNPLHRMFFMTGTRVHTEDLNSEWDELEEQTGLWATKVLNRPPAEIVFMERPVHKPVKEALKKFRRGLRSQFKSLLGMDPDSTFKAGLKKFRRKLRGEMKAFFGMRRVN